MKSEVVSLFVVFAILFGNAFCQQVNSTIKLNLYDASSIWWIGVQPVGDGGQTSTIEVQQAGSSQWVIMAPNANWGFWNIASWSGNGFSLPLSFRLNSTSGEQVVADSVLTSINGGSVVDTRSQWGHHGTSAPTHPATPATSAPTHAPATSAPTHAPATAAPTHAPATSAPTHAPATSAPTTPTHAPATAAPTHAPATSAPATQPPATPTHAPATSAPTHAATAAPTHTQAPTSTTPPASGSGSLCGITATSSEPLKIMVPLYVDPGSAWTELINAQSSGVQVIAIINPDSGPDPSGPDSSYTSFMQQFAAAGVTMLGYVHTSFGDRAISDVTTDISTYASLYSGLSGIFIDEAATSSSEISYYTQVYDAITSHSGYTNVVLNPGTQPDQGYLAVSTNIVIFEDTGSNFNNNFASWVTCAPSSAEKAGYKYRFSGIAHDVSSGSVSSMLSQFESAGIGLVYVTDGAAGCCTYNTLASYFSTEASDVASLN